MTDLPGVMPTDTALSMAVGAVPAAPLDDAAPPPAFADWPGNAPWQALPEAARRSYRVAALLQAGLVGLGVMAFPVVQAIADDDGLPWLRLAVAAVVAVVALVLAAWRASVAYRSTRWRLDEDGLRVRRGRLWRREIFVPRARVQHLDIERGPIERRYGLATLIVHTAGTRMHALHQPGFDEDTAARLRDALVPKLREVDEPLRLPTVVAALSASPESASLRSAATEAPASGSVPPGPAFAEAAPAQPTPAEPTPTEPAPVEAATPEHRASAPAAPVAGDGRTPV